MGSNQFYEIRTEMGSKLDGRKELDSIKEFYRYNSYVRKEYLKELEKLPSEELIRDRGASYPSMLDIFVHVLEAYVYWLMYRYPALSKEGFEKYDDVKTLEEAMEEERKLDSLILNFVEGLDDEKIEISFETIDDYAKIRWKFTVGQMLWHLVEEELQHRGELNALFWQLNIDPPITDWLDWKIELGEIRKLT
jgi:uncharacterized damage-inducible protein DinB